MSKPSWGAAPAWANYLAMDADGEWFWFENEPVKGRCCWMGGNRGKYILASEGEIKWEESREERPE